MFIDTHAHLYEEAFRRDIDEVVQRAKEAGVKGIVLPDIDSASRPGMLELEARFSGIMFPLIGLHPTSVNHQYKAELAEIEKQLANHRFYGIGECGIDLYWDKTFYKEQLKVFEYQMGLAKETGLPVVIHSRESLPKIFPILQKYPYVRGILHCFPGNETDALRACDMGFLLGIGGVVTFKNTSLLSVIRKVGIDHIVLETDAPYLTPAPYRGKRNESGYIPLIAGRIAEILAVETKKIEEITTRNAVNLFTLQIQE